MRRNSIVEEEALSRKCEVTDADDRCWWSGYRPFSFRAPALKAFHSSLSIHEKDILDSGLAVSSRPNSAGLVLWEAGKPGAVQ